MTNRRSRRRGRGRRSSSRRGRRRTRAQSAHARACVRPQLGQLHVCAARNKRAERAVRKQHARVQRVPAAVRRVGELHTRACQHRGHDHDTHATTATAATHQLAQVHDRQNVHKRGGGGRTRADVAAAAAAGGGTAGGATPTPRHRVGGKFAAGARIPRRCWAAARFKAIAADSRWIRSGETG